MITIAQISLPSSPAPSRAMKEFVRIVEEAARVVGGDSETVSTVESATLKYQNQTSLRSIHLLAVDGDLGERMTSQYGFPLLAGSADGVALWDENGETQLSISPEQPWSSPTVGAVNLAMLRHENLDAAYVDLNVIPGREDAYGPLWEAALRIIRAEKRSKVTVYTDQQFGDDHRAPSSDISLQSSSLSEFLVSTGFELTQTEHCSRLALPVPESVLAQLTADVIGKSSDYRLLSWEGPTPEEYREDMVAMMNAFTLDMPTAGIVEAEANYSVTRLVSDEKRLAEYGVTSLITAAQHIPTSELAGYTRVDLARDKNAAFQEDTLVLKEHRGHRLGMLVKVENLRKLQAHAPERVYVETWNAGENEWMWAINEKLGFRPHHGVGQWQMEI